MDPDFVTRTAFKVAGVVSKVRRGTESQDLFTRIWSTFEARRPEIVPFSIGPSHFGVSFPTTDENVVDYLAGMAVKAHTESDEGWEVRTVHRAQFAVFECTVDSIGATYRRIFDDWLPTSDYELATGVPPFEEYRGATERPVVLIHIPVRR